MDRDTRAVTDALRSALDASGLSQNEFARALGTSASRFSTYMTGRTTPSAAILLRAARVGDALDASRQRRRPAALSFATAIRDALGRGDEHWALALALEARDRLRDTLARFPDLAPAWEAAPHTGDDRWDTLLAALVAHEFDEADQEPPRWAAERRLDERWTIGAGDRELDEITANTPAWLAEHGISAHARDLATV